MTVPTELLSRPRADVPGLIWNFGGPISGALLDPTCLLFRLRGIDGAIGYRVVWRCAVAVGDPVCAPADVLRLSEGFRASCRARRLRLLYAGASARFAEQAVARGYAAVQFGEELFVDPRRDAQAGSAGRELRKKVRRAKAAGVEVLEYRPSDGPDEELERAMERVVSAWLGGRRGLQIYMTRVQLFSGARDQRWFYARRGERVVGVLSALRLHAHDTWLFEHLIASPEAPQGTSEIVATQALEVLASEGFGSVSFGPAPSDRIGRVMGLSPLGERAARAVYQAVDRLFHLDARSRFRRKFQVTKSEPSYLLLESGSLRAGDVFGLLRAFNASLA